MEKSAIKTIVQDVFEVSTLSEKTRQQPDVIARHTYCYLLRRFMKISFAMIGNEVNRNHASAQYSVKKANSLKNDYEYGRLIKLCIRKTKDLQMDKLKSGKYYWFRINDSKTIEDWKPALFEKMVGKSYLWSVIGEKTNIMDTLYPSEFETSGEIFHDSKI